jgi:integrase
MSRVRIAYVQTWRDKKTGRTYIRFRRRGLSIPLPGPIGSADFWAAYQQALDDKIEIGADLRSKPGTVSSAIAAYYVSRAWEELSEGTRRMRRAILERFREPYGEYPLGRMRESFLTTYLETLKPHAARSTLKALRGLLRHAKHDVTRGIEPPKAKSEKRKSWPAEEITRYEAHHAIGTKARLAFALAKYTGAGCSEIARLGPQHVRSGELAVPGRQKTGVAATLTIHPDLQLILDATPITGLSTFLVTKSGRPFRPTDLSEQFRKWCNEVGVSPTLSLHGLRHTMGDKLAEIGANPNEIAAVLAHKSARSALHYTQGADRKRMARAGMRRLISGMSDVSNHDPSLTPEGTKALTDKAKG